MQPRRPIRHWKVIRAISDFKALRACRNVAETAHGWGFLNECQPVAEWIGPELEVATMTLSTIVKVTTESDPAAIASVGADGKLDRNPWARPSTEPGPGASFQAPRPPGFPESPRIVPGRAKGTHPAAAAVLALKPEGIAKQVVVGAAPAPGEPELPYPQRHVRYAENAASLLRSISRRDRIFEDAGGDAELLNRLRRGLDDCAALLEQIRKRDRK